MARTCPKCGSKSTKETVYLGVLCLHCLDCGFDESTVFEESQHTRTSQREKGRYSPYKAKGPKRAI